jgi:hypothetical protein
VGRDFDLTNACDRAFASDSSTGDASGEIPIEPVMTEWLSDLTRVQTRLLVMVCVSFVIAINLG